MCMRLHERQFFKKTYQNLLNFMIILIYLTIVFTIKNNLFAYPLKS